MDAYKAKTYPGRFMDVILFLLTPVSFSCAFLGIVAALMQGWSAAAVFFLISASLFFINRLFRRRLSIEIFADAVDVHYLPQLFMQRGKTLHLRFADVADCMSGRLRFGRYSNQYLIIQMKNGKQHKLISWLPPFRNVDTYRTNCEEDITSAFRAYKASSAAQQA